MPSGTCSPGCRASSVAQPSRRTARAAAGVPQITGLMPSASRTSPSSQGDVRPKRSRFPCCCSPGQLAAALVPEALTPGVLRDRGQARRLVLEGDPVHGQRPVRPARVSKAPGLPLACSARMVRQRVWTAGYGRRGVADPLHGHRVRVGEPDEIVWPGPDQWPECSFHPASCPGCRPGWTATSRPGQRGEMFLPVMPNPSKTWFCDIIWPSASGPGFCLAVGRRMASRVFAGPGSASAASVPAGLSG